MSNESTSLAWEVVAKLTATTGRLPGAPIDDVHQRLVEWLKDSAANTATARRWLGALADMSPDVGAGRNREEYRLRRPLEEALGMRHGPMGIVGRLRKRRFGR